MTSQTIPEPGSQEALIIKSKSAPRLMMGKYDFNYDPCGNVGELYFEKARKNIRETPEVVAAGLEELRELLKGEPNLRVPLTDDSLMKFLRPCKWYPNSAFELMKRFFKFRSNYPQYNDKLVPANDGAAFVAGILAPVPLRTSEGERVLIIEAGSRWNPKKITLTQIFRAVILTLDAAITEPKTQIAGVHVIFDMEGLYLSQVTYFTPSFARAVLEWVQRCLPCRVKGIHIINQPYIFNMIFAVFKPFIHEKLRKRIHFHGTNRESLFNLVDPKVLPTKYGGGSDYDTEISGELFWKYISIYNEDFKGNNKAGYIKSNDKI